MASRAAPAQAETGRDRVGRPRNRTRRPSRSGAAAPATLVIRSLTVSADRVRVATADPLRVSVLEGVTALAPIFISALGHLAQRRSLGGGRR